MLETSRFVDALVSRGTTLFTGVPCSYLTPLINEAILRPETQYVIASSEGDALSIAAGAWLAGRTAVVMCQNSGLGNMVNPLSSLNEPFSIPVLLLVTWRGRPGTKDEPQHERMGKITPELLTLLGIEWALLPDEQDAADALLTHAFERMTTTQRPFAIVMPGDVFSAGPALERFRAPHLPGRAEVLATFLEHVPRDAVVIATTGKTGRELFTLDDRPAHLYCVGSMGYANAIAHGLSLCTDRPVFVLDGDGAALMHLGNLSSVGATRPPRYVHIVLDNGTYDSTGEQPSVSATVDFVGMAYASHYVDARKCQGLEAFVRAIREPANGGPRLLHVPIRSGSMDRLGRPTQAPQAVARRLRDWIAGSDRS